MMVKEIIRIQIKKLEIIVIDIVDQIPIIMYALDQMRQHAQVITYTES